MLMKLSAPMQRDVEATVRQRACESRVLDVFAVAEEVQLRFGGENVALEDIAAVVAQLASQSGCALELDGA